MKKKKELLFLLIILSLRNLSASASLITDVSQNYLKSFVIIQKKDITDNNQKKQKKFNAKNIAIPRLDEHTERKILFDILSKSKKMDSMSQEYERDHVLNKYALRDLNLLCGNGSDLKSNFLTFINRCETVVGEIILSTMIVHPQTNYDKIIERQKIILYLVNSRNENLDSIKKNLTEYKKVENEMLSLYTKTDPLFTKEYVKYLNEKFYGGNMSKNAGWLQFRKIIINDLWGYSYNFVWPCITPSLISIFTSKYFLSEIMYQNNISFEKYIWMINIPVYGIFYTLKLSNNQNIILPMQYILPTLVSAMYANSVYKAIKTYNEYSTIIKNLANRLGDVQVLILSAKKISETIATDNELENLFSKDLVEIRSLLKKTNDGSDVGTLIKYLTELPYKNWSYILNNTGKLLASYTLFLENKNFITDLLYEIGKIDVMFGMAKLIRENQENDDNYYTAVEIIKSTDDSPHLEMKSMWHPFINHKTAVPNDLILNNKTKNIILTGPNAGGKSTFLTGVTLNIILSQTFGIAAAKEVKIKPYAKINTYINIVDDLIEGNSLFMAEVKRVQEFISILKSLRANEFAFSIFDEPFSGTNPIEGSAAEYSILESIIEYHKSNTIVASHYPIVMRLEDNLPNKGFKNYKVYIEDDSEKLKYTYKVIPGKSTQTIAIKILEEQGFDTNLLSRAKDIIKNPSKY